MKKRFAIIAIIFLLLSSCGQYGALYLPHDQQHKTNHSASS